MLHLSVAALFYLEDSRKIHLQSMRACQPKDTKRRGPQGVGERERERASPLAPLFICCFLPPGPAPCKLGLGRSVVLPEVLILIFPPSFVQFSGAFPFLVFWTPFPYSNYLTRIRQSVLLEKPKLSGCVLVGSEDLWPFVSQCREEFRESKVIRSDLLG